MKKIVSLLFMPTASPKGNKGLEPAAGSNTTIVIDSNHSLSGSEIFEKFITKYFLNITIWFVFILLGACQASKIERAQRPNRHFESAVKDAIYREEKDIDTGLIAIVPSNNELKRKVINDTEYILVVTWKEQQFQYPDTGEYKTNRQIWVTVIPELFKKVKTWKGVDENLRLQQIIGLTPTEPYKVFVEFWVKPSDLFRPCPDKEITDNKCNLYFSKQDSLDINHINWMNDNWLYSFFRAGMYNQYPWTALGYTYDWNPQNKTHRGLSEFVVRKNSIIYIRRIRVTKKYLHEGFM